jgi:hypothetical protein
LIIPYSNILSEVIRQLIDEKYVKTQDGFVDFSKTATISTTVRILASDYLKQILFENCFKQSFLVSYPRLIIIASSADCILDSNSTYSVSKDIDAEDLNIDPLQINRISNSLLEDLTNRHSDVMSVMDEFVSYYSLIWLDERFSYLAKIVTSHFLPLDSYRILDQGEFIVDNSDYPVVEGSVEHFRIESLDEKHILYRAVESKLF